MASKNDTNRQIRLPSEMAEEADKVFQNLHITFSEAVRLFLDETIRRGKLPFRPDKDAENQLMLLRKKENSYVDRVLGTGASPEQRLLKAIFGSDSGAEMSDDQLKDWALACGLPVNKLSTSTLEELFDSGLFPKDMWDNGVKINIEPGTENSPLVQGLMDVKNMENIRRNIRDVSSKLEANAMSHYLQICYDDAQRLKIIVEVQK